MVHRWLSGSTTGPMTLPSPNATQPSSVMRLSHISLLRQCCLRGWTPPYNPDYQRQQRKRDGCLLPSSTPPSWVKSQIEESVSSQMTINFTQLWFTEPPPPPVPPAPSTILSGETTRPRGWSSLGGCSCSVGFNAGLIFWRSTSSIVTPVSSVMLLRRQATICSSGAPLPMSSGNPWDSGSRTPPRWIVCLSWSSRRQRPRSFAPQYFFSAAGSCGCTGMTWSLEGYVPAVDASSPPVKRLVSSGCID